MKISNALSLAVAVAAGLTALPAAMAQSAGTSAPKLYALPEADQTDTGARANALPSGDDEQDGEVVPRVVGGTLAKHANWPSLVQVLIQVPEGHYQCGGTVIAPQWVLTAGHCFATKQNVGVEIVEGTANLASQKDRHGIKADQVYLHEAYAEKPQSHNDIALIHLTAKAVSPPQMLLGMTAADLPFQAAKQAMVAGFGLTSPQSMNGAHHGTSSNRLMQVELPLVRRNECTRILDQAMNMNLDGVIDDATICAGDVKGGRDSCFGDSGGPLAFDFDSRTKVQIGVVSWGPGCAQKNTVGVYTSVAHFQRWIEDHVRDAVFYEQRASSEPSGQDQAIEAEIPAIEKIEQVAQQIGLSPDIVADLEEGNPVHVGSTIHFRVRSGIPGQLLLYNVDVASGAVYQIFPNQYSAGQNAGQAPTTIESGQTIEVPGRADRFVYRVKEPLGRSRLYAFVVPPDMKIGDLTARGLDMSQIPDPARLFQELSKRLATRGISIDPVNPKATQGAMRFEYEVVR